MTGSGRFDRAESKNERNILRNAGSKGFRNSSIPEFSIFNLQFSIQVMGGRFGKYGDHKRKERLKQANPPHKGVAVQKGRSLLDNRPYGKRLYLGARVSIRPAELTDEAFIRELSRKAFHPYGPYEDLLPSWFLLGIGVVYVAVSDKKPAGYAMLERIHGGAQPPRIAELLAIAVEPWAQRHGIGDRLMGRIIRDAKSLLINRLTLHTAVDNLPGQALFRKHGFVSVGIETGFYPEGQDALTMQKEMEDVR